MGAENLGLAINGRFLMQPTTGVQRVARELTRALDRLVANGQIKTRIRLVCEIGADVSDLDLSRITVEYAGGATGHFWEQFVLPRHVRRDRLLCLGNTAPILTMLDKKPVALMIHDLSYRLFPDAYSRRYRLGHSLIMPFLLRRADPIFTVSETEKAMLASLYPPARGRFIVAQNGGWRDDIVAKTDPGNRYGKDYVLYVGSFSRRKNFDSILSVAIRLARQDNIKTIMVGSSGNFLRPSEVTIPSDVTSMIRFAGQIEDIDSLAQLYANAACLFFPSFYEASPLPPMEAMSFGCPVVVSDIPSLRERCGDAAAYCDPNNVEDIFQSIRGVLSNAEETAALIERGYEQVMKYTWEGQARIVASALNIL